MKNVFKRIIIALTVLSLLSIVACDDILPANGEITLTSHQTNDTVSGTVTLQGGYLGDVEDVYVSYGTVVDDQATLTPRNATWSYEIDTTVLTDSIVVTIEGFKGTEPLDTIKVTLVIDNTGSTGTATFTTPADNATVSGASVTLSGAITGDTDDVQVTVGSAAAVSATVDTTAMTWTHTLDTTGLTDGSIVVSIEPFAGTTSLGSPVSKSLTVDNSGTTPTGTATFTTPADNATVSGASVTLSGAITGDTDDVQVTVGSATSVSATVDTTAMTWTYTLNTTSLTDGAIAVSVEPFAGTTSLGSPVSKSLTVDNSGTVPAGTATVTSHIADQVVSGSLGLGGDTTGDTDQVKISAGTVYTDVDATMNPTTGEWSFAFDTTLFSDANTTITIDAYQGTTKLDTLTLSLLIDNAGVQPSGTVSITDPYDGDEVFGSMVLVEGNYTGDVDTVEVNVGSEAPATATLDTTAKTWSYSFDSTSFTDGTLTLTAEAYAGTTPLDTDYIDVTVSNDSLITLSGTITVDTGGPQSGTMLIGVMDDTSDTALPVEGIEVSFTGGTYAYSIDVAPGMYYVGAFIDEDDDDEWDNTEWTGTDNMDGANDRPILNQYDTDTPNLNFMLMYYGPVTTTYDLGGTVTLGGGAPTTGDIWFGLFTETPDYDSEPIEEYWDTLDNTSSFDYTFFDVPEGDYTVTAYIDSNEDTEYQPGEYTGGGPSSDPNNPQLLSLNSDVYDNDFTIDWADTDILIGGTITDIPTAGHIYIGLFDSDDPAASKVQGRDIIYDNGMVYYEFKAAPGDYLVKAFVDMNDNGFDDPDDYRGADNYDNNGEPRTYYYGSHTYNVDFTLEPPMETYSIEGTITIPEFDSLGRSLPENGNIWINLYKDAIDETNRMDWMQIEDTYNNRSFSYNYEWVEAGHDYFVGVWIDTTGDGDYQAGHDHFGESTMIFLDEDSVADITADQFETVHISGTITVPNTEASSGSDIILEIHPDGAPESIKDVLSWTDYSVSYDVELPHGRYMIRAFIDKDNDGAVSLNDVLGYGTVVNGNPEYKDFFEDTAGLDITLEANTIEPDVTEDYSDTLPGFGPFTVPEWIDGDDFYVPPVFTLDTGADVDYLKFNNAAYNDFTVVISTIPTGNGLDVDTAIEVLDGSGNPLETISLDQDIDSATGNFYSSATFDLPARTPFILKVISDDGTSVGEYAVRISRTPISHVVVE